MLRLLMCLVPVALLSAADWSALCLRQVRSDDAAALAELHQQCATLNELEASGQARVQAWFSIQSGNDGISRLLFGVRGELDGLRKEDFPRLADGLRRYRQAGQQPFAEAAWLDMREIRRLGPSD